jgi:hypothetical protein
LFLRWGISGAVRHGHMVLSSKFSVLELWLPHAYGFFLFQLQNFKLIWLWTVFYELFQASCKSYNMYDGLLLSILMFTSNCVVCVLPKKNVYLCVAYDQYPNILWTFFYIKNIESFENVFSHGFLKHNKNYFLAFLDFTT